MFVVSTTGNCEVYVTLNTSMPPSLQPFPFLFNTYKITKTKFYSLFLQITHIAVYILDIAFKWQLILLEGYYFNKYSSSVNLSEFTKSVLLLINR